jgi:hypothetical protein
MNRDYRMMVSFVFFSSVMSCIVCGCRRGSETENVKSASDPAAEVADASSEPVEILPATYEMDADKLLAARLPADQASAGWIRLFDGQTLFGWEIAGAANWRVEEGSIVVDRGDQCLLCTSVPWQDYELTLEFKADEKTNSGIFLRTSLDPSDPAIDCYEVNIAPDDNPFPTASVVKRQKVDGSETPQTFGVWRTMKMRLDGQQLQVTLDDKLVCDYTDPSQLPAGRIGLQHNSGRIEFRNIRLRPLGLESLLDQDLSKWTKYPEMPGDFTATDEGWLHVTGGRSQLESKESHDDFVMLAEYKMPNPEMNSGIFFRCIPGKEMLGYECQLSNEMVDGNPLFPADCGSGGIFRRQAARVIAGEADKWGSVVLVAHKQTIAAWVNGLQVSNWYDDREPDDNPREGSRLESGTIMIQGHDPGTDALLKQISIAKIRPPSLPE